MKLVVALALAASLSATRPARADDPPAQTEEADDPSTLGFEPTHVYKVGRGSSPTEGPASAPVTIVGWSDFACEYCGAAQYTLAQLRRLYPGQLRFVHRTLPLDDGNTVAAEAAIAAAAQGRFAPMKTRLYALRGRVDRAGAEAIARELGLDLVRFRADLDTGAYKAQIAADTAEARALGVRGTPSFFLNGRSIPGNLPLRAFATVIDEELARARATPGATYDQLVAGGLASADVPRQRRFLRFHFDPQTPYRVGLGLPGHQDGPDDAPITIVAWSDFECPYCQLESGRLKAIRAKYGDKVRVIYRHYPVNGHPHAVLAAEAAVEAAEQGKFWAFHDQVFGHFRHATRFDLDGFARAIGLDMTRFAAALDSHRHLDAVLAEQAAGTALGIDGTPTMFVNGIAIVGARDEAGLAAEIDRQLAPIEEALGRGLARADVYPLVMSAADGAERGDPSTIGAPTGLTITPRLDDRVRGVVAACRRHDSARAATLARGLDADARGRAVVACAPNGVDL